MVEQTEAGAERAPGRVRPTADRRGSIPQRLNYLFDNVHAADSRAYSAAEVARWISDNGGSISSVYILKILSGERTEPSQRYLRDLAQFFGVAPSFFLDDDPPALDGAALDAQIRLRGDKVQSMLRRATHLSPRSLDALSDIIDSLLRAEGKDPQTR